MGNYFTFGPLNSHRDIGNNVILKIVTSGFSHIHFTVMFVGTLFIVIPGTSLYRGSLYRGSTVRILNKLNLASEWNPTNCLLIQINLFLSVLDLSK